MKKLLLTLLAFSLHFVGTAEAQNSEKIPTAVLKQTLSYVQKNNHFYPGFKSAKIGQCGKKWIARTLGEMTTAEMEVLKDGIVLQLKDHESAEQYARNIRASNGTGAGHIVVLTTTGAHTVNICLK